VPLLRGSGDIIVVDITTNDFVIATFDVVATVASAAFVVAASGVAVANVLYVRGSPRDPRGFSDRNSGFFLDGCCFSTAPVSNIRSLSR
jgi:hypothetical protein